DIVKITGEKSSNENPFFDVVFNFVNFHVLDSVEKGLTEFDQLEIIDDDPKENESLGYAITNTYLDCSANITGEELNIIFSLRKNLKSGKTLEDLSAYFENVISCYLKNYESEITDENIIPSIELNKLLVDF